MSTLFFVSADKNYRHFVPLYLFFLLNCSDKYFAEVLVEGAGDYLDENDRLFAAIYKIFGDRFLIREARFEGFLPGVVRFVNEPENKWNCNNVYIGDIDILVMDGDVEEQHLENMTKTGIQYSNIVRRTRENNEGPRMSGLHFVPFDVQYPLPDISDIDLSKRNNPKSEDERILYKIVERKGMDISYSANFRPVHGIHISMNRHPFGSPSIFHLPKYTFSAIESGTQRMIWNGIGDVGYRNKFKKLVGSDEFSSIYIYLDIKAKNLINVLENIVELRFDEYRKEFRKFVDPPVFKSMMISFYKEARRIGRKLAFSIRR